MMIAHPELDALRALWVEKCAGRAMPPPALFDAGALARWHDHAGWIEVESGGSRFRWRWIGDWLAAHYGVLSRRRDLDGWDMDIGSILRADLVRACTLKAPVFTLRPPVVAATETQVSELILPLSDDGDAIDALLVATYPLPKPH